MRNRPSSVRTILQSGFHRCSGVIRWIAPLFLIAAAFGQATVNEALETAYIYVDPTGSDANTGTKSKPLKTIGAAVSLAVSNNQSGIGSRVTVNPGTYRESITMSHSTKDTTLPITFQAATNGTVVVSGAVVQTGWSKYSANNSIYTGSWNNDWGTCPQQTSCPYQQEIVMRQELIAVNGTVLTQVLTLGQMQAGTFYVDQNAALVYVWPAAGTNMGAATVEIATSPALWTIENKSNLVIRGLTFQYANSCHGAAAVLVQGSATNILFDSDTFQWNNGQGIAMENSATYFTVENSVAQHNGDSGFQESETKYGLWQSDTTSYNNWRGAQGAYYACNTSGLHAWEAHDDTITNVTTSFNQTYGLHWDTDNINIGATGLNASGNLLSGLFAEKDEGPITLNSGYICNQNAASAVGGLVLRNSENVSLTNSVVMNNASSEIVVIGVKGGIDVTNWETNQTTNLVTQNFTNTGNTIQGNDSTQLLFKDSYLVDSDWTSFQSTLKSSGNTWWNSQNSTTPFTVATPKSGSKDNFSAFQGATGQDSSSSFKQPSGNPGAACNLTPVGKDYWITADYAALSVNPGSGAVFNLTLTPLSFTGTVTLTLDGISEVKGLSATLSASSIKTSGTSVLTVTAGSTTAAGTYSVTVIANNGSNTHTVTVQVTVN
jgi:hypothetical protein